MKISTRLRTRRIVRSTRFTMRRETRYQRNDKWTERAGSKNSKIAKRQSSRRCTYTPVYIALLLCTASPRLFAPRILYRHGAPCPPFSLLSSPPRRHTRWWKWDGSTYAFIESDAPLLSSSPWISFSLSLSFFPLSWHVLMARASTRKDRRLPFEALRHRTKERGRLNVAIEINADKKFDDK